RPSARGSAASSRTRASGMPMSFHHAIRVMVARPVEAAEARNSGASQVVSLHIGWLVALSSAPVEEATKNPAAQPRAWRAPWSQPLRNQRPGQRWGQMAARNEANEQAPKTARPQEPTDIGDQYLNIGARTASRQPAAENGKPCASASFVTSDLS